jgi:hypothetical protein
MIGAYGGKSGTAQSHRGFLQTGSARRGAKPRGAANVPAALRSVNVGGPRLTTLQLSIASSPWGGPNGTRRDFEDPLGRIK